jgi:RNA-directed DNA polymerase
MIQETFTSNGDAKSIITKSNDEQLLDMAWEWLCRARKNAPPSADIWDLRLHWPQQRDGLLTQLKAGRYRLSAMWVVGKKKQAMWTARDALVLKWVALKLAGRLPLHPRCEHVKGHGGGAASLRRLSEVVRSGDYPWVCRTDIKGYYGTIQKPFLLEQLRQQRLAPEVLHLLEQYLHYSVESGGEFHTPERGIPRGCALSPLMGALHLWAVDNHFARQPGIYYARYMDDFVILTKTRWQLRRQVASLNRFFNVYGFRQHPDKTFIGRTAKGFDWMGAQLGASGVTGVAPRAQANHWAKVRRLYEQTWLSRITRQDKVSVYRARWIKWAFVVLGAHGAGAHAISLLPGLSDELGSISVTAPAGPAGPGSDGSGTNGQNFGAVYLGTIPVSWSWCGDYAGAFAEHPITQIDGYAGLSIAPGAILVVSGSIALGADWLDVSEDQPAPVRRTEAAHLRLDERGHIVSSTQAPVGGNICASPAGPRWRQSARDYNIHHGSASLSYRVYVKPGSPAFSRWLTVHFDSVAGPYTPVSFNVDYVPPTCTIAAPGSVSFGDVGVDSPRPIRSDVKITCTGAKQTGAVTIRATSPAPSPGALGTLLANDASGTRVGVVSGYWGTSSAANCGAAPTSLYTDGRGSVIDPAFPASSEGTSRDYPITWTLCPDRGAVPGVASGRVSLEATW